MSKFGVTPQKEQELYQRMEACGVQERDLSEGFVCSGGPGGQHVNRTATCVHLVHGPSGVEVKMQQARSQGLNRFYARRRLCELLEAQQQGKASPEARRQEKIRKQKNRRRRRQRKPSDDEPA